MKTASRIADDIVAMEKPPSSPTMLSGLSHDSSGVAALGPALPLTAAAAAEVEGAS